MLCSTPEVTRNYSTYARRMNEIIRLKYLDIREAIRPGRIVDKGCADGALLAEISRDFPDSDLFGIDISAEFKFQTVERTYQPGFLLSLRSAAEFLSKKDYLENWKSEMNEESCFCSFTEWKQALSEAGFHVLENSNQPERGSRAYTNPWIVQNRYEGHAQIFTPGGSPLAWPPTNMVLVAEKPAVRV